VDREKTQKGGHRPQNEEDLTSATEKAKLQKFKSLHRQDRKNKGTGKPVVELLGPLTKVKGSSVSKDSGSFQLIEGHKMRKHAR